MNCKFFFLFFLLLCFSCNENDFLEKNSSKESRREQVKIDPTYYYMLSQCYNRKKDPFFLLWTPPNNTTGIIIKNNSRKIIKAPFDGQFVVSGGIKNHPHHNNNSSNNNYYDYYSTDEDEKKISKKDGMDLLLINDFDDLSFKEIYNNENDKKLYKVYLKGNFHFKIPVRKNDQLCFQFSVKKVDPIYLEFVHQHKKVKIFMKKFDRIKIYFIPISGERGIRTPGGNNNNLNGFQDRRN